ncbi:MAG: methyltransferase domain-containing protein [Acidobacteria bacterium]|nr:methyltransferase domain-containing protein [Acidobacteriota bacterium]
MTDARFESGAPAYAAYLQTVEGRLRLDIAWENFLSAIDEASAAQSTFSKPETNAGASERARTEVAGRDNARDARHDGAPDAIRAKGGARDVKHDGVRDVKRALDLGGGTGALALRFAALGWHSSIVDPSASMLALAADAARAETFAARVTFHRSAAETAHQLFAPRTFDAATCHNVLEYVSDPRACVRSLAALLKPGAVVSLVARNRAGEAMRAALKSHDLDEAEHALTAGHVNESLYGGPARLYDAGTLQELATDAGLHVLAARGVRVVADYLPASLSDTADAYARLLSFERTLGARPEFAAVARYTQIIARKEQVAATA